MFILLSLAATPSIAGGLLVTWNANTESDLAGYRIYYGTESSTYTNMVDVGKVTSYILPGLQDGRTYYVAVTAYDLNNNESLPSLEVSAVVSRAEIFVEAVPTGIHLRWTIMTGVDTYEIYADNNPYFTPQTPLARITTNEYTDVFDRQVAGLARYYIVKAVASGAPVFTFDRVGGYNLGLHRGRNLVSLPLIPADRSLTGTFGGQLNGASNASQSDKVLYWKGNDYEVAWLVEGTGSVYDGKWMTQAGNQESPILLDPDRSFWVNVQASARDTIVTVAGKVSMDANRIINLVQGTNFIGSCYPLAVSLLNSELVADAVVVGGKSSSASDKLMQWRGPDYEVAWLVDNTGTKWDKTWFNQSGSAPSKMNFSPGVGYILWIKGDNPAKVWSYPNPNPNK